MTALALLASLFWGWADYLGGATSKRVQALAVTGFAHLVGFAGLLCWALLDGGLHHPGRWLPLALVGGVLAFTGLVAFYTALARGRMGVVAPITATGASVPVLYGLATGDVPPAGQLVGVAIAIAGVVLAAGPELRGGGSGRVVMGLTVFTTFSYGAVMIIVAHGSREYPAQTLAGMRFTSVLLALGVALVTRSIGGLTGRVLPLIGLIGVTDTLANVSYALASRGGHYGVMAVLASLFPVVTALLARWLLHERLRRIQIVGVVTALTGVAVITVG